MTSTTLSDITKGAKPQTPVAAFSAFLDKLKPQLALALPKHMNADRMARLALTSFSTTPKLQQCTPQSIAGSLMTAGQMGLEPGVNGQGFLVPYGKTCAFVPGWKGLVDLVSRSGRATAWTGAVFDGDDFDYQLGDAPFVHHRPGDENDADKMTHAYAVGRVNGSNHPVIEVWTVAKITKHRNKYNKVGKDHYSYRDWEMYARKVPLLQVIKYLPQSVELSMAIAVAEAAETGGSAVIDVQGMVVTSQPAIDPDTGETSAPVAPPQGPERSMDGPTYAQLADEMAVVKTAQEADAVLARARHLPEDQQQELRTVSDWRGGLGYA